ncbi:hypothetical protein OAH22_01735 [bacterium]|nr:hypothetical protein [bacterium]
MMLNASAQSRPISAVQSAPTDDFLASNPANAWRLLHERSVGPRSKSRESGLYFTGHLAAQRSQTNRVDEHRSLTMGQPLLLAALTM